jgi:hypothetical protein
METHTLTGTAPTLPMFGAARRSWLVATAAIAGGATVIAGTLLPWLTLFAGLHPYRGIIGWNGRVLLAGGVLAVAGGVWLLVRDTQPVRRTIGALGVAMLAFVVWLLVQQNAMYHDLLSQHPMTVPGVGPGLHVASGGALLIALTLLFGRGKGRQEPS